MWSQRVSRDQRRDQTRNEQREEDRRGHRQAELFEILTDETTHESHRCEHGDDRGRCGNDREADLVSSIERRLIAGFSHAHMTHDIFYLYDRIVDEHTRHQRQCEHAHAVECEVHRIHEGKGRDRR